MPPCPTTRLHGAQWCHVRRLGRHDNGRTAPAFGSAAVARGHAKRRRADPELPALTELDYVLAVDDFSRVGALRLRAADGSWYRTVAKGRRITLPLIEREHMYRASRAVECGREPAEDLRYLQGKGTSLGGMRPKCTMVDEDGWQAIGKFPSVGDTHGVTRGEVLALRLAAQAGIDAARAGIVLLGDGGNEAPVAVIRRFDRDSEDGRIPYQSAASLPQASREQDRSYNTEIADAIRSHSRAPTKDVRRLWRRLVPNLLITNVNDQLQNHGFLHMEHGLWCLAPAFDINPFPDKDRESKTWLTEQDGPVTDVQMLLARASYFAPDEAQALAVLGEAHAAVSSWRRVALCPEVGLRAVEPDDFASAFEHEQMDAAAALLGR